MTTKPLERHFESQFINHLVIEEGYSFLESEKYDKDLGLFPKTAIKFVKESQPQEWEKLVEQYGIQAEDKYLLRLKDHLNKEGIVKGLKKKVETKGCKFDLVYFKPQTTLNQEHVQSHSKNILSVSRQFKYSTKNNNSIDIVIVLNGIPIMTCELKNIQNGQNYNNAIQQYKKDRDPKELIFKRSIVNFAMDNDYIFMTTELKGKDTRFLPFNKDIENPINPDGNKTDYLFKEILTKNSILNLLDNFILEIEKSDESTGKKVKEVVFPRYHQLDSVRKMLNHSKTNGVGHSYLIQHSAGSGKSNTISWLAHQLSSLHDDNNKNVFDSIIVITDRRVLDSQLKGNVTSFEEVEGTTSGAKHSKDLKEALEKGKKIIISTLQKFSVIAEKIQESKSNKFALLIDEGHSSWGSSESRRNVNKALNIKEDELETELTEEDLLTSEIESRGKSKNVSYFAFTATPKQKTLELFGTKKPDGTFEAFHIYSMSQAIKEGFILDVLENYTTYKSYFRIIKTISDNPEYSKSEAVKLIMKYVNSHDFVVNQKLEIMVEHFRNQVLLNSRNNIKGNAKAMIVTSSRENAVKYKLAFDKYIKQQNYNLKALVAFTGEITLKDNPIIKYTEANMNNISSKIEKEFKKDEYKFLIVANKYQTGFSQPLLNTMYVDKQLGDVNAVQTLSRLNRTHPDKINTFVLDFINETEDIVESFQRFYVKTILSEETDSDKLYNIKSEIYDYHIFTTEEIDNFVSLVINNAPQEKLEPILNECVSRWEILETNERKEFRNILKVYNSSYNFLSQVITFKDLELEKLYLFSKRLIKKLFIERNDLPYEVLNEIDINSHTIRLNSEGKLSLKEDLEGYVDPMSNAVGGILKDEKKSDLRTIIEELNELFGTDFTTEDQLFFDRVVERTAKNKDITSIVTANDRETFVNSSTIQKIVQDIMAGMVNENLNLYSKIMSNPNVKEHLMKNIILHNTYNNIVSNQQELQ